MNIIACFYFDFIKLVLWLVDFYIYITYKFT